MHRMSRTGKGRHDHDKGFQWKYQYEVVLYGVDEGGGGVNKGHL